MFEQFLQLEQIKGEKLCYINFLKIKLKKFKMEDCEPVNTPMVIGCKLRKNDESAEENQTLYM
jgi:hypothetical protein